jgi:hypothetical protein
MKGVSSGRHGNFFSNIPTVSNIPITKKSDVFRAKHDTPLDTQWQAPMKVEVGFPHFGQWAFPILNLKVRTVGSRAAQSCT